MGCSQNSQNGSKSGLGDVSSAALDGLDAFIKDQKAKGLDPSIIGKTGGPVGDIYDIYQIGKAAIDGGWTPALVNASSALGGLVGAAIAIAFVGSGIGAVGIIAIGAVSYIGSEIGEALGEFLFDPTLEPEFYEETLRNREQRLRERGIDPETDPGTQNIRRQL